MIIESIIGIVVTLTVVYLFWQVITVFDIGSHFLS